LSDFTRVAVDALREAFPGVPVSDTRPVAHDLICWNCGAQYHGAVDDCPHCDGYGQ
jgi:hypothetical protein